MSYHVPFKIEFEIMIRLPVKSLIRFSSVSKTWKSLINSLKFIADYTNLHSQRQHILIRYKYPSHAPQKNFVSIVDDDDTFREHKLCFTTYVCFEVWYPKLVGSSHGLFCFLGHSKEFTIRMDVAVIWNPSIRKTVVIHLKKGFGYNETVGFGVCPNTLDPKIVRICKDNYNAEVFTLNSRMEEFMEIHFPDELGLSRISDYNLQISKLRESLTVIRHKMGTRKIVYEVWKMENIGVTRSFTKLYNINISPKLLLGNLCGFNKNGQLIVEAVHDSCKGSCNSELIVYDPCTKNISNLGIYWIDYGSSESTPYTESLLLLDKPYIVIFDGAFLDEDQNRPGL
ncbi:putative F-box protein At1g50870 [Rutidosis leptorrhynchoides]|uniref:putative F-box protein At1g50870 n=1 Tax=Rutidosis leptorrhynchoides TaxID=125765 RepID=UPI003A995E0D